MYNINKIAVLFMSAAMLAVTGCSGSKNNNSEKPTTTTVTTTRAPSGKVELKSYDFPEFLNERNDADMLGIQLFKSFEPSNYVTDTFVQPLGDYVCSSCIDGCLYVFSENGYKGLLNAKGDVVVKADTYTDIKICSQGMLVFSKNKELNMPDEYAYYDDNGKINFISNYSFNPNEVKIEEYVNDELEEGEAEDPAVAEEAPSCKLIFPRNDRKLPPEDYAEWDSIEPMSAASIDTTKAFSAYFKAKKKNMYYIIAVDKYYNYSIFSGAYGLIRLKVGDSYGECYILNYTDYDELLKMVDSFGSSDSVRAPGKDEGLDYIQIVTGIDSGNTIVYTISADGFCLTDTAGGTQQALNRDEQPINRYFTLLDKESFISLVQWVDKVLSAEYESLVLVVDEPPMDMSSEIADESSDTADESSDDENTDTDSDSGVVSEAEESIDEEESSLSEESVADETASSETEEQSSEAE